MWFFKKELIQFIQQKPEQNQQFRQNSIATSLELPSFDCWVWYVQKSSKYESAVTCASLQQSSKRRQRNRNMLPLSMQTWETKQHTNRKPDFVLIMFRVGNLFVDERKKRRKSLPRHRLAFVNDDDEMLYSMGCNDNLHFFTNWRNCNRFLCHAMFAKNQKTINNNVLPLNGSSRKKKTVREKQQK